MKASGRNFVGQGRTGTVRLRSPPITHPKLNRPATTKTTHRSKKKETIDMLIELHAIQNFAPSNLNRDDTGAPKDCTFGGYRRARVSSQAFKRAMRMEFRDGGLLPDKANIGTR